MQTIIWKIILILSGSAVLSACIIEQPGFWSGYAADMFGPVMTYILLRDIYNCSQSSVILFRVKPETALFITIGVSYTIETCQYFQIYQSTFDRCDYLAYISLLVPVYLADRLLLNRECH